MKKFLGFVLGLTLTAGLAYAVNKQLDVGPTGRIQAYPGGLVVAPLSLLSTNTLIDTHRVTRDLAGSGTIDFASQTITCNTGTITVTGARTGDICQVSPGSTGGAANSSFTCYVSASNTVTVKHCPAGTASDPASQTYYVRVTSNQ